MNRLLFFFSVLAFAGLGVNLFSQTSPSPRVEGTVEDVYLQSQELQIIQEQALALDQDQKLLALSNISHMFDDGKIAEGDQQVGYLLNLLVNEGIGRQIRQNNLLINDFPVVRKEAAALLGRLRGESAKNSLLAILRTDNESMVLSEAVYQLGVIGLNANNEVSTAIADALDRQSGRPSDNFAYACLLAFQKLAVANNRLQDGNAIRAIITVAQGPYLYEVRRKANEVLNDLRQY
ncbi:MAG: HEAT repeat domain-containing protein [Spirochaetales bacterium]|jgi:hypothetical protein|nr:HEAT repeat domain-containing protein [Spirochaetales bacterium]